MAETFLFSIAAKLLQKLGSDTLQQFGSTMGLKLELKKLEETLSGIKAVLLDADKNQAKNRQLTFWLEGLKDACYHAEYVLDEFMYEGLRQQVISRGSLKSKVSHFFSHSDSIFRFVIGRKIKKIRRRLDEIAANKVQFHLTNRDDDWHVVTRERKMPHSFELGFLLYVFGKDTDRETIVALLTSETIDCNISVVPIVGIGGLGKTAVARLVYNDDRVNECFELKMWISVSDDFTIKRLTKDIITSVTCYSWRDLSIDQLQTFLLDEILDGLSIDQLQTLLRDKLQGKKFLLILDDVWNHDLDKWDALRELLQDGANGSKIIVTTQSHSVASIVATGDSYILKCLSDEDSWSLFVQCAFKEGQEKHHPNLERFGREIVKKCHGVPLAVRVLGSILFMTIDERDWLAIKENEIWTLENRDNDIFKALKLSYNQLPSYLKQCFAFCSIFPKDDKLNNIELVQLWMAHGFIQPTSENEDCEDIGNRYIEELLSRSLFQELEDHGPCISFKMHDLVHDLAVLVAQSECYTISNFQTSSSISKRIRHVSFCDELFTREVPRFLLDLKYLRTIYSWNCTENTPSKIFVERCFTRFSYICVLDLSNLSFEVLPCSAGSLKHLRLLNLSGNTTIEKLPKSVCKLFHLQYLGLEGCIRLMELPRDIGNLISLWSLTVTAKHMAFMPEKGIGSLSSLRYLCIHKCSNLTGLEKGVERLTALRTLLFNDCENLESLPPGVKYLPLLETLMMMNCGKLNSMESEDDSHQLRLFSLRSFSIVNLPQLKALPMWLQKLSKTLQYINVSFTPLTTLPEWLPNLSSLQRLEIWSCPLVSVLPEGMQRLTSLTKLHIEGCPDLSRKCKREIGEDWHKISHIPNIYLDREKI